MKVFDLPLMLPLWRKPFRCTRVVSKCLAWVLIFSPQALAQEGEIDTLEMLYGDEETVSIATGSAKPLYLAPSIASVITADDIRAMGANNLDDVLESVPGLHVSLIQRYSSMYSIRGIHTKFNPQVLVLLNGYPLSENYSGGRAPKLRIPLRNIKRVEIIRGPGSAVFGADAFAGVINIITFSNEDLERTEFGATLGSFDTKGIWFRTRTQLAGWDLGLSVEWEQSDGDPNRRVESDLQTVFDGIFSTNASRAPGHTRNHYDVLNSQVQLSKDRWAITLNSWRQDEAGIGVGIADALDLEGYQYSGHHLLDIAYVNSEFAKNWTLQAHANYFYLDQRSYYTIFPPGVVLPIGSSGNLDFTSPNIVSFPDGFIGNPGATDEGISSEISMLYSGVENHRTRFAVGYKTQAIETVETKNFGPGVIDGSQPVVDGTLTDVSGTPFVYLRDQDRDIYFFSIQDEWSIFTDWELTAGIRFDDYSVFGDTINPRVALVWQTDYNLTSKLLYGRAFRAPSFSELFAINNPINLGNPNLDPEEIDTVELSFDYRHSYDVQMKLNLFSYEIDGLIDFIPDPGASTSTAQNAQDQEGYGLEFELHWSVNPDVSMTTSFSWQNSENTGTGADVADAPQQLAYLDLRWKVTPKWRISAQAHHVGSRPRTVGDSRDDIGDYNLVNVSLYSEELHRHWDLNLSIHNLFDKRAFEPGSAVVPIDHELQGRSVLFQLEYRLAK